MNIKKEFPILKKIIYLDAASAQLKPISVVKAIKDFYTNYAINPISFDNPLSIAILNKIKKTKIAIANLLDSNINEIIFTSGTTDSINSIAQMLKILIKKNDEIILSKYNHDSNILPWIKLKKEFKIKIIITNNIKNAINNNTRIISVSDKNNGFGENIDIKKIYKLTRKKNIILINDAAQSLWCKKVSLSYSDVIVFSGNKIYGPTGIGGLVVRQNILKKLVPFKLGGRSVSFISKDLKYILKDNIHAFEAGTPNTAGIIGLGAAIDFLNNTKNFINETQKLALYTYKKLSLINGVKIYTKKGEFIIIFNYKNFSAQDIVSKLAHKYSIYMRAGLFCAQLGNTNRISAIRISLSIHNTWLDIDYLLKVLQKEDFFTLI